jgi:hypothetical protein
MCRALQIVCVAAGEPSLRTLKRAVVSQDWELTAGATNADAALHQIAQRKAHVLVTWGAFADLVGRARKRFPGLRIVTVGRSPLDGADVHVTSIKQARDAILGSPPVGGPVRS